MSAICVHVGPEGINLRVDEQHISRLSVKETSELIAQVLIFSKPVREKVQHWLREGGEVESIGNFLSPAAKQVAG